MLFGSIYEVRIIVTELSAHLQFCIFLRKFKKAQIISWLL